MAFSRVSLSSLTFFGLLCLLSCVNAQAIANVQEQVREPSWARTICCAHRESKLACKEAQRYLFTVSGHIPTLLHISQEAVDVPIECQHHSVLILSKHHPVISHFHENLRHRAEALQDQHYHLQASWLLPKQRFQGSTSHWTSLLVIGGHKEGVLHGVYSLLRHYGIHFRIEGDVLPAPHQWSSGPLPLVEVEETGAPTFDIRGLQPFHDFPEGPDWWDGNQYKAIFSQLSKMKMNFLGLHTYPYADKPGTGRDEPTVWVGLKDAVNPDGNVKSSYPTSYANTMRNQWGDTALPTGNYSYGAKQIFENDCYGSPVQAGNCPLPTSMEGNNEVFQKTGEMLKDAFQHAHSVNVMTCVGTETPLSKPPVPGILQPLNMYYSKTRQDHFLTTTQCAECEGLYDFVGVEGFIQTMGSINLVPINTYYNGKTMDNVLSTVPPGPGYELVRTEGYVVNLSMVTNNDSMTALSLYYNEQINDHLSAANPQTKQWALSNGYKFVTTIALVEVNGTVPTTQDYYEGIFTRIKNLGLPLDYYWIWTPEGWEWGKMSASSPVFQEAVADLKSALAAHDAVNASFEMATCGWVVGPLPDRSIFDKVLPSQYAAITSIDMQVGNTPVDPSYKNITNHKKWAIPWMEDDPGLTAPELWVNRTIQHMEDASKYGCNGLLGIHWRTKATSPQIAAMAEKSWTPELTSADFWKSWSMAEFGIEDPATVFEAIDSFKLPRPVNWIGGPGGWSADPKKCSWQSTYAFVDTLESMQAKISGEYKDRYLARFNYWLYSFMYMRAIAMTECAWAEYNSAMNAVEHASGSMEEQKLAWSLALPARISLVHNATSAMAFLLQTVVSPGEMGTVMNVLSHSLVHAIEEQTAQLEKYLQKPVPAEAMPSALYSSPSRLIVPTVRTHAHFKEQFSIKAMVLSPNPVKNITAAVQVLQPKEWAGSMTVAFTNIGRNVWEASVKIPSNPNQSQDPLITYYIAAELQDEPTIFWPPGAPASWARQTIVVSD